jgi:hypothetical protein
MVVFILSNTQLLRKELRIRSQPLSCINRTAVKEAERFVEHPGFLDEMARV